MKDPNTGEYVENPVASQPKEEIMREILKSCKDLVPCLDPRKV